MDVHDSQPVTRVKLSLHLISHYLPMQRKIQLSHTINYQFPVYMGGGITHSPCWNKNEQSKITMLNLIYMLLILKVSKTAYNWVIWTTTNLDYGLQVNYTYKSIWLWLCLAVTMLTMIVKDMLLFYKKVYLLLRVCFMLIAINGPGSRDTHIYTYTHTYTHTHTHTHTYTHIYTRTYTHMCI